MNAGAKTPETATPHATANVIRLGIAGGGGVGHQTLGLAQQQEGVEAVAVAEPDELGWRRLAEKFGVETYATVDQMLAGAKLDAVKICTPNDLHGDHAVACLDAGLHVLCEKPLATHVADGQAIIDAARRSKCVFMVNFEYRCSLLFARIKELIDAGTIGKVVNIHFNESRGAFHGKPGGWRFDQKRSGGTFVEKLCHYMDLAVWFSGAPIRRVHALAGRNTLPHYQVTDNVHAIFELDQGVTFSLTANHAVAADHPQVGPGVVTPRLDWPRIGHDAGFRIAGERGALISDDWRLTLCVNRLVPDANRGGWRMAHDRIEDFSTFKQHECIHNQAEMLAQFIRTCQAGKPLIDPDADVLLNVLAASIAAEEAMAQRISVAVANHK